MLNSDKPKRVVAQAPLKETTCHAGCGAVVQYRTSPRVICEGCRPEYRKAQVRASVERQRRKRGVPEVKGAERQCKICDTRFVLNRNAHAQVCEGCRDEDGRRRARARVRRLCRERGAPEVGTTASCRRCQMEFTIVAPRNFLCVPCGEKSVRSLHPEQRIRQKDYQREWLARDEGRERNRTYQFRSRQKRKANPAFAINERMSASVRQSLVLGKQGWRWESLVGFTLADLMAHLEAQFLPGMSWENRGEWHIDHIRPLCSFQFETPDDPQFREAWAITNLRPLWARDNLRKGGRLDFLL